MKKLIIAALLVVGMTSFAQQGNKTDKRQGRAEMEKFTPEQRNELMLKKMTLELDLSSKQQAQMKSVIAEKSAKREAMMEARKENKEKMTSDQRFAMKSKMMDEQIAMKAKMKSILSAEQFEKWDAMKAKHHKKRGMHQRKGMHNETKKEEMKK
ncbi:hypothetical protein [Flavobacterium frigoris]|uniref:LTXXQ motif family protein n=1 Tax=Flavobacterium frigoris (strain PS1) TaxID=1086011 RepID=H7FR60_FLAFP|nr:hypothetical protein [Flavobacterium frigoris]EIA08843.1 hypothetical protein HJ01_01609 [Flavobacterium frigoris PS1]